MNMTNPSVPILLALLLGLSSALAAPSPDWLIDPTPFKARVNKSKDGHELELNNGLLRRVIRIEPNAATDTLDNLSSGRSLLCGVPPEVCFVRGQNDASFCVIFQRWPPSLRA